MDISMKLPKRIDTENAKGVQEQIDSLIMNCGADAKSVNITLDADGLDYISSAGLRVMLSTKKKVASLVIINASSDVCDIFKVTGFDEFITISEKIEEVSIEGLTLIGMGATAKVYRLNNEKVVKVYDKNVSYEEVLKEQEMTKKAIGLGIDTMISYGIVKVGDSYGAVFEMIDGKTILEWIKEEPENLDHYVGLFVDFVKKNQQVEIDGAGIHSIKKLFYDRIDKLTESGFYSDDEAMTARQIIYSIPDKDTYVHGDCHVGNVMYSKTTDEVYFIDLPRFAKGNPVFDLFGMAWVRLAPAVLDNDKLKQLMDLDNDKLIKIWQKILAHYFDTNDRGIIEEMDRQYAALECLNLSMAETFAPGLFTPSTLEWLKAEGLKAAEYDF